jgi:lipopolysaccharide export system protein LptA
LLVLICAACLSSSAFALKTDRSQPMDLKAERWNGSMQTGTQVWNGKVSITQGSLSITADKATLHYKDGAVERAELLGSPARVQQALDGGGQVSAQAGKVDYYLAANKVTLSGAVRIEENGNVTQGERFDYALDTGALQGDGGSGQVSLRILPKPKAPEVAPANPPLPTPTPQQR